MIAWVEKHTPYNHTPELEFITILVITKLHERRKQWLFLTCWVTTCIIWTVDIKLRGNQDKNKLEIFLSLRLLIEIALDEFWSSTAGIPGRMNCMIMYLGV